MHQGPKKWICKYRKCATFGTRFCHHCVQVLSNFVFCHCLVTVSSCHNCHDVMMSKESLLSKNIHNKNIFVWVYETIRSLSGNQIFECIVKSFRLHVFIFSHHCIVIMILSCFQSANESEQPWSLVVYLMCRRWRIISWICVRTAKRSGNSIIQRFLAIEVFKVNNSHSIFSTHLLVNKDQSNLLPSNHSLEGFTILTQVFLATWKITTK